MEVLPVQQQQDEWRQKLDSLQSQHRSENIEQQTQHLQQLRLLQEQLLQDINLDLSAEPRVEGGQHHPLPSHGLRAQVCEPNSEANDTYLSEEASMGGPLKCGEKLVSPSSPSLLKDSVKRSFLSSRTVTYDTTMEESHNVDHKNTSHTLSLPSLTMEDPHHPSETNKKNTIDVSPSSSPVICLPSSPNLHSPQHTNSPGRMKITSNSPRVDSSLSTAPSFFAVSPKQAWAGPSFHPPSPLSLSIQVPPSPPENKPRFVQTPLNHLQVFKDRLTQSPEPQLLRSSLLEKHARHVQDLKTFYESELSTLSERLQKMEEGSSEGHLVTTPTRRSLNFDNSMEGTISPVANNSPWSGTKEQRVSLHSRRGREEGTTEATGLERVRRVEAENVQLKEQCHMLQALLDEANR